jgi:hypothetical protein
MNQLKVVSNVLEGEMKVGCIMWASVVQTVVFNALCLALEYSWQRICNAVPLVAMILSSATAIVVAAACLGGRAVRFFFFHVFAHGYLAM